MTRFLIIGDLHGNKPKIYSKEFDAIIAPGDFCSDALREYVFAAMQIEQQTGIDIEWYNLMTKKKAKKMLKKSMGDGRKILESLNALNKPVFVLPGNWDWTPRNDEWKYLQKNHWRKHLIKNLKNIRDCHKKTYLFQKITIIGHGITSGPEYPIGMEIKNKTNSELKKSIKEYQKDYFRPMHKQFICAKKHNQPIIFLSHNVPYNTKLDKINNPASPANGKHRGSYLARHLILKHQPLICIGGHMHEHFGKTKIKKTIIVNAGFGSSVNTVLEITNNKITKLDFIKNGKKIKN